MQHMCKPPPRRRARRRNGESCQLGVEQVPLKIVRASNQYIYDEGDIQYLDCVNSVAHVGHCHPSIVEAVVGTVGSLCNSAGWEFEHGSMRYPKELQKWLPEYLNTFLFCNSGSEAVDLAVQLARLYTQGNDVVVVDNAFHGSLDSVQHLSPKMFKANNMTKVDWVHVIPMPDLYRGPYQTDDPLAVQKYLADARDIIDKARMNGRKIACFICEPMLTMPGCIVPPALWLQDIYRLVREFGGLCIADEVQTGVGRIGSHFCSFEAQGVVPDILIIGKAIGNGYPMAAVVTTREIAANLGERTREYKCSAVMDAVGCTVLDILQQQHFMSSAMALGKYLYEQLTRLKQKHGYIGDVRGQGLMFGVEIVWDKQSKKPAQEIAEEVVTRLKKEYVIVANEGDQRNIIILMPPMCFSQEDAISLTEKLDKVLSECANNRLQLDTTIQNDVSATTSHSSGGYSGVSEGRLGQQQPQEDVDDDNILEESREDMDLEDAHHRYQDLD